MHFISLVEYMKFIKLQQFDAYLLLTHSFMLAHIYI